MITIQH